MGVGVASARCWVLGWILLVNEERVVSLFVHYIGGSLSSIELMKKYQNFIGGVKIDEVRPQSL
jgi:hypothetical protein